jgi:lipoprotein NlpI
MEDPFIISLNYKGETRDYQAQLIVHGYTHRYKIWIDEAEIFFEPDEEDSYRAISMQLQDQKALEKIDKDLLFALQQELQSIRQ